MQSLQNKFLVKTPINQLDNVAWYYVVFRINFPLFWIDISAEY